MAMSLLTEVRQRAGLTVTELARRSATSRPTLSAYEHGRVSPRLDTVERVVAAAGHGLRAVRLVQWRLVSVGRGRVATVPDELPRLDLSDAVATVDLPLHIDWSSRNRSVDLSNRSQRLRAYEVILREGRQRDIERYVDGALLVDAWEELVLPRAIRAAWDPVIEQARHRGR
jgi:transcriptional regulator with XRE-family HTH domain